MSFNSIKINTNEVVKVDEQPTTDSDNLVKSGGVRTSLDKVEFNRQYKNIEDVVSSMKFNGSNPTIIRGSSSYEIAYFKVTAGERYKLNVAITGDTNIDVWFCEFPTIPVIGVQNSIVPFYKTISAGANQDLIYYAVTNGYFAISYRYGVASIYNKVAEEINEKTDDSVTKKSENQINAHYFAYTQIGEVMNTTPLENAGYNCEKVVLYKGDKIYITANAINSTGTRAFVLTDINNIVEQVADFNISYNNYELIAENDCNLYLTAKNQNIQYRLEYKNSTSIENIRHDLYLLREDIAKIEEIDLDFTKPLGRYDLPPLFISCFRKITCIGDSLTESAFNTNYPTVSSGVLISGCSYPSYLQKDTGVETINLGISGYKAKKGGNKDWYAEAVTRGWFSPDNNNNYTFIGDAAIIALGTNDVSDGWTGDVTTDIDENDADNNADTSVGGYARIIQKLKEISPKIAIFCVTISNERNVGATTKAKAQADIKEIASMFNCFVIDLETYAEPTQEEQNFFSTYYKNGGHNNALGYRVRARQYAAYIDWIIYNNIDKFQDLQFIGTDWSY